MGSYTNGVYVPAIGETGWGIAVDDLFTRVGEEHINVKLSPYGAAGNGTTDDTTAVQAALTAASSGGMVFFPPGTYKVSNLALTGATNLTLCGSGATIKGSGGANPVIATFTSCDDLRIEGLTFDANGATTFGGVKFYDCSRVWVVGNRYYDSNPQVASGSDIYSFVFTKNTDNNTDVHIINNVIEDLQLEVDHCTGAEIAGNKIYRSDATASIGVFSTATGSPSLTDYHIHDNYIVDGHGSGGAICALVDPVTTNNCTFKRFSIHDNIILFTGASTPKAAITVGTTNNSQATTGNVFTDIHVNSNTVIYAGGSFSDSAILFNSSTTAAFTFERSTVANNRLYGTGAGTGIDVRKFNTGAIQGNMVKNFSTTLNVPSSTNTITDDIDSSGVRHIPTAYIEGTLLFGSAGDTNLYRSAANKLKTDDVLLVPGDGATPGALQVGGYAGSSASSTGLGVFGNSEFTNNIVLGGNLQASSGSYIQMTELSGDPSAPSANQGRLYLRDNGAGKTQLCVRFPTGAVQVIATEP